MFSSENGILIPTALNIYILSFLDDKDLKSVEQTCKKGKALAGNNLLWQNLFRRVYQKEPSQVMHGKEAFMRQKFTKSCTFLQCRKIYLTFLCNLKLDKKRQLEIIFPPNHFIIVDQGYGSKLGTDASFNQYSPDEKEYYSCVDPIEFPSNMPILLTPPKNKRPSLPIYSNILVSCDLNPSLIKIFSQCIASFCCYREVSIDLDIGSGNKLGYYSAVNDWKKPFVLFPIEKKWVGRIPNSWQFRYVKIDSEGKITWEKRENNNNRYFTGNNGIEDPKIEF